MDLVSIEYSLRGLCTLFLINEFVRGIHTTPLTLREKTHGMVRNVCFRFRIQSKVFFVILFLALELETVRDSAVSFHSFNGRCSVSEECSYVRNERGSDVYL